MIEELLIKEIDNLTVFLNSLKKILDISNFENKFSKSKLNKIEIQKKLLFYYIENYIYYLSNLYKNGIDNKEETVGDVLGIVDNKAYEDFKDDFSFAIESFLIKEVEVGNVIIPMEEIKNKFFSVYETHFLKKREI